MDTVKVSHFLFCDELEVPQEADYSLTLYYFGILIKAENIAEIEQQVLNSISKLLPESFHAIKHYKNRKNWDIFEKFNEIILTNKLEILCFAFVKDWLKLEEFKIINTLSLPQWKEFPIKNYRAKAFYLFLHVLNYHLNKVSENNDYVRVFIAEDWLKNKEMVEHEGVILNKIENVFSTRQKSIPILALPDHVAYLFNKKQKFYLKKEIYNDKFSRLSEDMYLKYCESNLFKFLDLKEWIKNENSKYF